LKNPKIIPKNKLPDEANDLELCRVFKCTPNELDAQDAVRIIKMTQILNLEAQHG